MCVFLALRFPPGCVLLEESNAMLYFGYAYDPLRSFAIDTLPGQQPQENVAHFKIETTGVSP